MLFLKTQGQEKSSESGVAPMFDDDLLCEA